MRRIISNGNSIYFSVTSLSTPLFSSLFQSRFPLSNKTLTIYHPCRNLIFSFCRTYIANPAAPWVFAQQICFRELCAFSVPNYVTNFPLPLLCSLGRNIPSHAKAYNWIPIAPFPGEGEKKVIWGDTILSGETTGRDQMSFETSWDQNSWKASWVRKTAGMEMDKHLPRRLPFAALHLKSPVVKVDFPGEKDLRIQPWE